MAIAAVLPAMNGDKALHPFFRKPAETTDSNGATSGDDTDRGNGFDGVQDDATNEQKPKMKRKSKDAAISNGKTQKTLDQIVNPTSAPPTEPRKFDGREIPNTCSSDMVHENEPARKKRRTSPVPPIEKQQHGESEVTATDLSPSTSTRHSSPQAIIPASSPLPTAASDPPEPLPDVSHAPKKLLRLKGGKFSSPPTKKPVDAEPKDKEPSSDPPQRRGRPRRSKEVVSPEKQERVVIIKYATENDRGDRIDRVLRGEERVQEEVKKSPRKLRTPQKKGPAKPTHPFFIGKPKEQPPAPKPESPQKVSTSTPVKPKKHTVKSDRPRPAVQLNETWTSSLLKDRLMMKHPGAKEPAWPSSGQMHVRSIEGEESKVPDIDADLPKRKRKAAKKDLSAEESLLTQFASGLTLEDEGGLRDDGFREPHPSLRLPRKLLISGEEILEAVSKELSVATLDESVDELSSSPGKQAVLHPAVERLCKRIPDTLSAFDDLRGEGQDWTQKYAPTTAAEVLQPSRQMDILKTRLISLAVTSVESAVRPASRHSPKPETKPAKKRRRKNKDMDDFLVDSDEEVHDMDELTDPEDDLPAVGRRNPKSVVQSAADGVKLSNAVLLTGPHGCGKTAAAYAVAKELGYRVFEISSSERRSGKDVLEKVGDMAENHLVKHHGTESGDTSAAEEPGRNEETFQRDLASGRQGKMDSFFKPKAGVKKAVPKAQPKPKVKAIEQLQQAVKRQPKDQQQSLILLEEVDILFKDDKDFWSTVLKMITTSKRPFIMTCNDEDLVPLQVMSLHAILRFSPPPIDLAADYLLTVAAAEGHLIKREAVVALYETNGKDLRAAISELNFWCQMAIGDPKLGLSWVYQRYPPGSDLDEHGRRLRVVSEGSYQTGMGHVPDSRLSGEDQALWMVESFGQSPLMSPAHNDPTRTLDVLPSLKEYQKLTASLSAADLYTSTLDTPTLDITQPPMTDKARSQYIEGMRLVQTDETIRYDTILQELAISSSFTAHRVAGLPIDTTQQPRNITPTNDLTRRDFACFDAISIPNESMLSTNPGLSLSAFDGPLRPIALDLAPYVRSILQHEAELLEQQNRLNSILGEGQSGSKRMRTTRAARSALHGSQRSLTRRDKWFTKDLDVAAVLATGGKDWPKATANVEAQSSDGTEEPSLSAESL